jgi:Zn-dependent membrane protease YugP
MFFDFHYMLVMIPGLLLSAWASYRVKSTFHHYSQVRARSGLSGAEAAREVLRLNGLAGVQVEPIEGFLSDHYDPSARVLRLSPDVYQGRSLAALGVAAHEAGHALQHAADYKPLAFRSLVVKPAMFGTNIGLYAVLGGLALHVTGLVYVGIALFSAFVLFTLITLPVEFDASQRAIAVLGQSGMLTAQELEPTRKVLSAAALTYVAGAIGAVLQLLYLLWRAGLLGGQRSSED